MSSGIKVWNNAGALLVDSTSYLARFAKTGSTGSIAASGYVDISVPGMVNDDSWFVMLEDSSGSNASATTTKSADSLRITNNSTGVATFNYWVVRT
jgi:hypothetical protein